MQRLSQPLRFAEIYQTSIRLYVQSLGVQRHDCLALLSLSPTWIAGCFTPPPTASIYRSVTYIHLGCHHTHKAKSHAKALSLITNLDLYRIMFNTLNTSCIRSAGKERWLPFNFGATEPLEPTQGLHVSDSSKISH